MPLITRALGLLSRTRTPNVMTKAGIAYRPPKHPLTPMDQAIGLGLMFVVFLVPSGWVLSHMEDYKKKPE